MAKKSAAASREPSIPELVEGVVDDAQKLLSQQFELLREEVREEIGRVKTAAVETGAGAGRAAVGAVFAGHGLVHLLHRASGLPLWGCYGVVAGLAGAAGAGLMRQAQKEAVRLSGAPLPQTTGALRENWRWLKQQATPGPA